MYIYIYISRNRTENTYILKRYLAQNQQNCCYPLYNRFIFIFPFTGCMNNANIIIVNIENEFSIDQVHYFLNSLNLYRCVRHCMYVSYLSNRQTLRKCSQRRQAQNIQCNALVDVMSKVSKYLVSLTFLCEITVNIIYQVIK